MGKDGLSKRDNWQTASGKKAKRAELSFLETFVQHLDKTDFIIRSRPPELSRIYVNIPLSKQVLTEIYTPPKKVKRHGINPDYAIENTKTGKTLYIEVKRQDGWVEGKKRSDGRGNAHERLCKYFTTGLLKILHEKSGINNKHLPFWVIFQGDITRDPCRVREITSWFDVHSDHMFFWRDTNNPTPLLSHFDLRLKHLLY